MIKKILNYFKEELKTNDLIEIRFVDGKKEAIVK